MSRRTFRLMPDGASTTEKFYTIIRHHLPMILKRVREHARCRNCFTHGWRRGAWTIKSGCDGCAEVDSMIEDLDKVTAGGQKPQCAARGEGVRE